MSTDSLDTMKLCDTITMEKSTTGRDKYSKLLNYLKIKNYEKFDRFINTHVVDVDHKYGAPDNGTLLDIACRTAGNSKFVETLVIHNAAINFVDIFGKAPIHNVVQNDDLETLRVLLQSPNCDPHIQDKYGNSVLHFASIRKNRHIVELLKQHLDPDIVAWKLVDRALVDLVENQSTDEMRDTLRSLLEHNPINSLFSYLYNCQCDQFIKRVQELKKHMGIEFLYDNDGFNSYMQYACKAGLAEVVVALLNMGIDPNQYWFRNPMTPIMIAAFQGYHRIVNVLLDYPEISLKAIGEHNVLHCLFYGMFMSKYYTVPENNEPCDYFLCLDHLHKKAIQHNKLDVNSADEKGYTALHYAVQLNHKEAIKLLIDAGADVCQKNHNGESPLTLCNSATLEEYLDSCISFNDVHCGDTNHTVIFRYHIFTPQMRKSSGKRTYTEIHPDQRGGVREGISEIGPLMAINDIPELRKLLKHPVIMSFITLKWHVVKKLFYYNLFFYIAFWLVVSLYVFLNSYSTQPFNNDFENLLGNATESFDNATESFDNATRPLNNVTQSFNNATRSFNNATRSFNNATRSFNSATRSFNNSIQSFNNSIQSFNNATQPFNNARELLNKSYHQLHKLFHVINETIYNHPRVLFHLNNATAKQDKTFPQNSSHSTFPMACSVFRYIASVLLVLLSLRELFKLTIYFRHYVKSLENWLIASFIILTGLILTDLLDPETHSSLASMAILAIWLELVLLLGRLPRLSTNQEMFKRFTYSFLKFTHWFSLIIFAYVFSLYIKFIRCNPRHYKTLFKDPIEWVYKLFVLTTGGVTNTDLAHEITDVSQMFYFTLIFFIAILLFNLLNGLAVCDTQDVRSEAELIEITSRLNFISYVETIAMNVPACYLKLFYKLTCDEGRNSVENFYKGLHLFPYIFTDRTIHVSPNAGNQVLYATRDENCPKEGPYMVFSEWKIDSHIVKKAVKIYEKHIQQKKSEPSYDEIMSGLVQQLSGFNKRLETLERQNNEVLNKLPK